MTMLQTYQGILREQRRSMPSTAVHRLEVPAIIAAPKGVDLKNRRINGYVVAQVGTFKSEGRGQFTLDSLREVVKLMRAHRNGTKSFWNHQSMFSDDLSNLLGKAVNPRLDGDKVRADLLVLKSADKGDKLLALASEAPELLSSSLVLETDEARVKNGPPVWMPTKVHSSDIVQEGEAVDELLSTTRGRSVAYYRQILDRQRLSMFPMLARYEGILARQRSQMR